eukprot:CAMPEP_0115606888 /NCGR_PEP_ID=MMETSP0272-20121206/18223_1 /TAXON_ID=71861 /ORGANISM="Scrippsiella trochoidea, Strain CCMP3099" /LENGTH=85 /DNA_ID=CAMNT_0003042551 /DNA_START=187 /DNA_END=444 /DNA_ORIENTATION=+
MRHFPCIPTADARSEVWPSQIGLPKHVGLGGRCCPQRNQCAKVLREGFDQALNTGIVLRECSACCSHQQSQIDASQSRRDRGMLA